MPAVAVTEEGLGQVLRLAEHCDPAALSLTPAQGFLFSRIDGQTPWRLLREIGGLAATEVDACLEGWLASGIIEIEGPRECKHGAIPSSATKQRPRATNRTAKPGPAKQAAPVEAKAATADEASKPDIDESRIDTALDLDESAQRRILEFEAGLDRSYYEILGVARDANPRELKRAYFRLSKDFHPDRYFRRNIGDYSQCLDRIFKKVLEAHELLSDPATRAEVDKAMPPAPIVVPEAETPQAAPATKRGARAPKPRVLTPIERLKQRMPFKISEARIAERRGKAAVFHQSAQVSARGGRYLEAASSARLAIAFDPNCAEYKRSLTDIRLKSAEARVADLLRQDDASMDAEEQLEALSLYEETLMYRPHDPIVNDRAAQLAISCAKLDKAMEYAERAVEHSPEMGAYHRTLGRVFQAQGDRGHAVREYELALKHDKNDGEARKLLTALKRRWRRSSTG